MCFAEFYCRHACRGKKIPEVQWEMRSVQARKFRIQWECAVFIFASLSSAVKNNSVSHTLQCVYLLVVFIFFGMRDDDFTNISANEDTSTKPIEYDINDNLTQEQKVKLNNWLNKYRDVFFKTLAWPRGNLQEVNLKLSLSLMLNRLKICHTVHRLIAEMQ